MTLVLSGREVKGILSMQEAVEAIENGFLEYARGNCDVPIRPILQATRHKGRYIFMPSYLADSELVHTKVFSIYLENPKRDLPPNYYYHLLHDSTTGELKAIIGGNYLTNLRTAATAAVATKYLARKDSHVLAIFGVGPVSEHQLVAMITVASIEKIYIFAPNRRKALDFANRMGNQSACEIYMATSPQEAVNKSDIIVTATSSTKPVFNGRDLKPGTHINAIGGIKPDGSEIDEYTACHAKIFVETIEGVLAEAGEIILPIQRGVLSEEDIYADLAELVTGQKPGRTQDDEITLFKSVGFAIEDAVIVNLAYAKAITMGLGTTLEL